jgi:nucleotide-binding universal stress UspA family protein
MIETSFKNLKQIIMANRLYNILVPVDFTEKNKWAITKAVELANSLNCNIHLVHVVNGSSVTPFDSHTDRLNSYDRLKEYESFYSNQLCGNGKIEVSVLEGNAGTALADYATRYEMDLIVIGLPKFNPIQKIFSQNAISHLAKTTNVPVLAVRSGGLVFHFKKILLPLHNEVPIHRIQFATLLAKTFKSTIYMVALRNEDNTSEKILSEALQIVQNISTIPVQGIILEGKNLAKTTVDFAKRINADLIMINPLKEFHLPGWWNRFTNKLLSYASRIPVITVGKVRES